MLLLFFLQYTCLEDFKVFKQICTIDTGRFSWLESFLTVMPFGLFRINSNIRSVVFLPGLALIIFMCDRS